MEYKPTQPEDDANYFGKDVWIYCRSHMAPHTTGWCTVPLYDKVRLFASTYDEARGQCQALELPLYKG